MKLLWKLCLIFIVFHRSKEDSYSHKIADSATGYEHRLSLYLTECCAIGNLGQAIAIKGDGITKYIFCPATIPRHCPSGSAQ